MNWIVRNNSLTKNISFNSQTELAEFVLKIAKIADNMHHHPDYIISKCNQLEISLSTHDKNGITEKDHALAERIEQEMVGFDVKQLK